jgi:uncharacterized protein (TIGR03382 family)/uncharacterized repeat protein (TIGR01451 family)
MKTFEKTLGALAAAALLLSPAASFARAKIVINNQNGPGDGFNDPTPAKPVGGNPGTTGGEQRQIAFAFAAGRWGATIQSDRTIVIDAKFSDLECSKDGIVLGAAGPTGQESADPSFPEQSIWYPTALANAFAGKDFTPSEGEIQANFNWRLGDDDCGGADAGWYYGLDGKFPVGMTDLPTVLLHEFSHGLGFLTFSIQGGHNQNDIPDIFEKFAFDNVANKTWLEMTDEERAASSVRPDQVVWSGTNVTNRAATLLDYRTVFGITAPAGSEEEIAFVGAEFGPKPGLDFGGEVAMVMDAAGGTATDGCAAVSGVSGKIALIDRSLATATKACSFKLKVANAQAAGATAVIISDYANDAEPPGGMADDAEVKTEITIPSMFVLNDSGQALKAALQVGTTTVDFHKVVTPNFPGTDANDRVYLYTPAKFNAGSSVSHFNSGEAVPSLLMEPYIHTDIPLGLDLTPAYMADIGWTLGKDVTLAVSKAGSVNAWPGGTAQYIITVLNHGSTDDTNVVVSATNQAGLDLVSVSGAGCTALPCTIAKVAADSRATLVVTYALPLDYTSPDPVVEDVSFTSTLASAPDNAVTYSSKVEQAADVVVTSDVGGTLEAGEQDLAVKITNAGPSVARGIDLTTDVPTGIDFNGFAGDCSGATCHIDVLNPGESKTVTLKANVSGDKAGSFRAIATSETTDPYESNNGLTVKFAITGGGCSTSGGSGLLALLGLAGVLLVRRRKVRA